MLHFQNIKFILLQYKTYSIFFLLILGLYLSHSTSAKTHNELFISTNTIGTLGYLELQQLPINQSYMIIDLKNMRCGAHIQGYVIQQGNRLILNTSIHDPNSSTDNQCILKLLKSHNIITITNSVHCQPWHGMGCDFSSTSFIQSSSAR